MATPEPQTLRQYLKEKLHGRESLFTSEHLEILSDKRLNTQDLLPTATWKALVERPTLPYVLIVELLHAFNQPSLQDFDDHNHRQNAEMLQSYVDAMGDPDAKTSNLDDHSISWKFHRKRIFPAAWVDAYHPMSRKRANWTIPFTFLIAVLGCVALCWKGQHPLDQVKDAATFGGILLLLVNFIQSARRDHATGDFQFLTESLKELFKIRHTLTGICRRFDPNSKISQQIQICDRLITAYQTAANRLKTSSKVPLPIPGPV